LKEQGGWIWSTDWFVRKEEEIRRATKAFGDAVTFAFWAGLHRTGNCEPMTKSLMKCSRHSNSAEGAPGLSE
jgi:hypothetical protein